MLRVLIGTILLEPSFLENNDKIFNNVFALPAVYPGKTHIDSVNP